MNDDETESHLQLVEDEPPPGVEMRFKNGKRKGARWSMTIPHPPTREHIADAFAHLDKLDEHAHLLNGGLHGETNDEDGAPTSGDAP